MNMMTIDPTVFNSAVNYNIHEQDAVDASKKLKTFLRKLTKAANHSTQPPYADFTIVPFTLSKDNGGGMSDYLLWCQNFEEIIPEAPVKPEHSNLNAKPSEDSAPEIAPQISNNAPVLAVSGESTIDFSFGVFKDSYHVMRAGVKVRHDTAVETDANTGNLSIRRKISSGSMKAADQVDEFATSLFSWVHDQLPKKDRPEFMRRCEEQGLVHKKEIGFRKPSLVQSENNREVSVN